MNESLPVFELKIDTESESEFEVNYVALVNVPAIQKNFLAFDDALPLKFGTDEERIIIGAAMVPDMLIYRKDATMGEFYVKFTKQTIEEIALKFFEKGYQKKVNLMHNQEHEFTGVTFFQSFIKDTAKGITGMEGEYPEGTWFLGAKVQNDVAWNLIKEGKVKGFSVEGMFKYHAKPTTTDELFNQLKNLLKNI